MFLLVLHSKYLVSSPLVAYYYTQMIGDAKRPPTLLASSGFTGAAVIGKLSVILYYFTFNLGDRCGPLYPRR
jgi:hypothetical protein